MAQVFVGGGGGSVGVTPGGGGAAGVAGAGYVTPSAGGGVRSDREVSEAVATMRRRLSSGGVGGAALMRSALSPDARRRVKSIEGDNGMLEIDFGLRREGWAGVDWNLVTLGMGWLLAFFMYWSGYGRGKEEAAVVEETVWWYGWEWLGGVGGGACELWGYMEHAIGDWCAGGEGVGTRGGGGRETVFERGVLGWVWGEGGVEEGGLGFGGMGAEGGGGVHMPVH
ncbi:hypothetical protein TrCOL_g7101 [Triparma columacea]|uniref:Uncharacterized protein n=1 Tax=Triparma columacea TaxID=722753 RepID=A0A9W7GEP0_9STRA|nr:hypothetical protein TrCOL_g7101 [Triparma columacea]